MQVKQESAKNQRLTRPLGKPAGECRINGRAMSSFYQTPFLLDPLEGYARASIGYIILLAPQKRHGMMVQVWQWLDLSFAA